MANQTPQAIGKYESHNDGSLGRALCSCKFCKYVRHLRQPWISCPFKVCPTCRPDLRFNIDLPRAPLSQAKGKAPDGWRFNQLFGLTDDERECLKDLRDTDKRP